MNIGLLYTPVSIYQMTRGALVLFVGVFSVIFLKRRLWLYQSVQTHIGICINSADLNRVQMDLASYCDVWCCPCRIQWLSRKATHRNVCATFTALSCRQVCRDIRQCLGRGEYGQCARRSVYVSDRARRRLPRPGVFFVLFAQIL
jgi:hypothetical protein